MANTYTQIYIHVVFAVEGRQSLIQPEHNEELQKYIAGIVSGRKQKLIVINNMPDHVHMLVGLKADLALSDLVRDVKAGFFGLYPSKKVDQRKIRVAGRLRRLLVFTVATQHGDPLYPGATKASCEKELSRGIRRVVAEI